MAILKRLALSATTAALLLATSARAQVTVQVRDSAAAPIAAARVELWTARALVAARSTDAQGLASFSAVGAQVATSLVVRSIGFSPARQSLAEGQATVVVTMSRLAQALPAATIRAVAQACPQTDDPGARELWRAVSVRYRAPTGAGRFTRFEQHESQVAEHEVGSYDNRPLVQGTRAYTAAGMSGGASHVARRGYAYPLGRLHNNPLLGAWSYPALEAELGEHFVSAGFGASHTFTVVSRSASVATLRFCARDRRRSGLDGTMRIAGSDGMLDARWRYWNPADGAESAGGEATFVAASQETPAPLFTISGLFWRKLPSGRYVQRWQRYQEWQSGGDMPGGLGDHAESPTALCRPPENYVLCSAVRMSTGSGAMVDCNSKPYRCGDKADGPSAPDYIGIILGF